MKKISNLLTVVLFLAVIGGLALAFWIIPDRTFSKNENRVLSDFPTISVDKVMEGELSEDFNAYFTDQFPFRDTWLTWGSLTHLSLGQGEANGVLVGKGGQLAVRKFDAYISLTERAEDTDYYSEAHLRRAAEALGALTDKVAVPVTVLPAPRTLDVAISAFDYPAELSDTLNDTLHGYFAEAGVDSLDLLPTFRAMYEAGDYVYYRTDHHWTTPGAYAAYEAIMTEWGMADAIIPYESFEAHNVEDFYGTTWSRAGLSFIRPDTLTYVTMADDDRYMVRDNKGEIVMSGFVDPSFLDKKDKYGAFMSGTHRLLTVTYEGEDETARPRLLIARDSFASSLAPFLARHFDLVMVDLSGGMTHLSEYVETYGCDRILIVYNIENFVTADAAARID